MRQACGYRAKRRSALVSWRGDAPHPLIIGGGPAGAAAAALIAAAGRPVTLVERNAGPTDKLCGDFLSGGAIAALHALGLDPLTMGPCRYALSG